MNPLDYIGRECEQRIIDAHYSGAYEVLGKHLDIDSDNDFRKYLDSRIPLSRAGFLNPITFYNNFKQITKKDVKIQAVMLIVACSTIEKLMENLSLKTTSRDTIKKFFEKYAGEEDKQKLLDGFEFVKQDTTTRGPKDLGEVVDILYGIRNAFTHHAQLPQSDFREGKEEPAMLGGLWIEEEKQDGLLTNLKNDGFHHFRIKLTISEFEGIFEKTTLKLYGLTEEEVRIVEGM